MKPVKSDRLKIFWKCLTVLIIPLALTSCNSSFNSAAPSAKQPDASEASALAHTTDARVAYVFSDNVFEYIYPCGEKMCKELLTVGNPVHSYSIDPVSGLPSSLGIENDSPPINTRSITVSPSDRFLYMLTGDSFIHSFLIGFSIFSEAEFKDKNLDPLDLYNALSSDGYITGSVLSAEDIVKQLNSLLEQPALYDRISANNSKLSETDEIIKLKAETKTFRMELYSSIDESGQKSLVRLNRLMIEASYPGLTPISNGDRPQHASGSPVATPTVFESNSFASIVSEPFGKFIYVLGTEDGKVAVYVRDQISGELKLSGTQSFAIDQILFASSGLFAYGSNNGNLYTFSVNRETGLLEELGTPFTFRGWLAGPDFNNYFDSLLPPPWQKTPFPNMAADPTGKFLYLIGSSGTQLNPGLYGSCPDAIVSQHQLGSLIYTFIIDNNTGLLTQAGPPLDTTPHIVTGISVDPLGRFVQLLNTHEYYFGTYIPDGCAYPAETSPLKPGAIYSYYVDQSTGTLISSGSVQAGGTQVSAGFVTAGMDSVSITGNATGIFLYLLNSGDLYVYNVDQANGALTAVGSPLTGATAFPMPGKHEPVVWPSVCYTGSELNGYCTFTGSRSHSLTWAGY